MPYIATLSIDVTRTRSYQYRRLVAALVQAGWDKIETSSFMASEDDLMVIMKGLEAVTKQVTRVGTLSALSISVVLRDRPLTPAKMPQNALQSVLAQPGPSQAGWPTILAPDAIRLLEDDEDEDEDDEEDDDDGQ